MKQVHLKLLLCLLLVTSATGQLNTAGQFGQGFGGQQLGMGQSSMGGWGGFSGGGAFGQQGGIGSQFGGGFGQGGAGFGQGGIGSQFGGGFGQGGAGFGQGGAGFGQGGAGSQFGGGFGQQQGFPSQVGAGQAAVAPQVNSQQSATDTRVTNSELTSGTTQQFGSSAAVPAAADNRALSTNVCYNIIDSVYPSFSSYCSVLPQTTFSLPNFFDHKTKQDADDLLNTFRPALDSGCFKHIRMFTCPLFFPPCDSEAILPCASFCRAVKSRCGSFDLTAISCDQLPEKSEFCPTITAKSRSFGGGFSRDQSAGYNNYGPPASRSRDLTSTSYSSQSSSYGSNNDLVRPRANTGGYYGGSDSDFSSDQASIGSTLPQTQRAALSSFAPSRANNGGAQSQDSWTIDDVSSTSSSTGGFSRSAPILVRSGNSGYGSNSVTLQQDNSYGSGNYGGNSNLGSRSINSGYGGSPYGNSDNIAKSVSLGNGGSLFGNGVNTAKSVFSGNGGGYGGSSYGNGDNTAKSVFSGNGGGYGGSSYGNGDNTAKSVFLSNGGSLFGNGVNTAKSVFSGNGGGYGGSSYGNGDNTAKSVSSGNGGGYGGSSYGNSDNIAKSVSLGNGGSSFGNGGNTAKSVSYGSGGSSYGNGDNTAKSVFSGNDGGYGGSSYGTGGNTAKSSSYGNGGSYGGSSYGNSGSYGSSYGAEPTGPPYGVQSTGEYTNYYPEKLDLSKCGPTTMENPCTLYGAQYYPLPGYPNCYIQCSLERMFIKPCPNYLVWNSRINVCDWPTKASDSNYGSSTYGSSNNNYASSSSSTTDSTYGAASSYPYGRKKRATTERKKRFFPGFPRPIASEVPIGPPIPGFLPLPGLPGPIGIPGPLIPPPFFPPFFPPIGPIPPPIFPPPLLPPFLPPLIPPFPVPLGGPLLPPLPMSIPATFIPGPPPLFGAFGGPLGPFGGPFGPLGGPLGGGFGGPLGGFGGGIGGPFGGFGGGIGGPFGGFGGGIGGFGGGFGGPFGEPFGGGFGGPFGEPFGGGFGGPFGEPFGGGFGGGGFIEPFFDDPFDSDFGFGGGFPFGDEFYGGFPGPFFEPFPFPGGYDTYGGNGRKSNNKGYGDQGYGGKSSNNGYGNQGYNSGYGGKGNNNGYGKSSGGYDNSYGSGYNNGYGGKSNNKGYGTSSGGYDNSYGSGYNNGYGGKSNNKGYGTSSGGYDNSYGSGYDSGYGNKGDNKGYSKGYGAYDNSYDSDSDNYKKSSSSYDDSDSGYSKKSSYDYNGNFDGYKSKNKYGSSSYKKDSYNNRGYDDNNSYRNKRQYGLNVDQDTSSFSVINQQRSLPTQFQMGYNPSSYGSHSQQQSRLLPSALFQLSTESIRQPLIQSSPCIGKSSKANVAHPTDLTKYISCLNERKFEIMDCPTGLIYNSAVDQCEKIKNTESICERDQPCMNDGQCYQTSPSTYKCTCRGSWTGERCETALSSCATDPCGPGNECQTLATSDYKQDYVCVCDGRQSYGASCGRNTVPNPCMAALNDREQYYPFAFSARAYVQCNGDILYVRPCAGGLYWNQEEKICAREETSPARPAEDQPQSYQINYNSEQQQTTYNRPSVSVADQSIDKQQGHRYRNYNPHLLENDQSTTFNQILSRKERPHVNSYFSPLSSMNQNRRLQNQQQFIPINTFSSVQEQQPLVVEQAYGQTLSQQPRMSVVQNKPQRSLLRVFQPSSSRIISNSNTQPISSSYRR